MKILLIANTSFKLVNFRSTLIQRLVEEGHSLTALVPVDNRTPELTALGVRVINMPMHATGTSPFRELKLLLRIFLSIRRIRPDAILGYTIKPNIYGALSARALGIPFIPNVTGLGSVFDRPGLLKKMVKPLYRTAFRHCPKVYLQNPDDLELFLQAGLIDKRQARLLPGSGVDLAHFAAAPLPNQDQVTFLLVARMLGDKGVEVFAEAAESLHATYPQARFQLLGPYGTGKAGGLTQRDIARLTHSGVVSYLGETTDVRPYISAADCVVLPTFYREGTPRSLLEAAAVGRPVITTNMPGCRDVVEPGVTGYLCPPRDSAGLAAAMGQFLKLSDAERTAMGNAARIRMATHFDEETVINAYLETLDLVSAS
ncbi:glycosyltransferase family 4 protein [Halomonas sp. M5N1S17]|uniref:glycosyltransferase family 4 protein n=1 Tax=Halomonas alkalisoli TaxID=2907158 RepID=UPI001F181DEF|nr:glycosyltransferase family 4 protein [Halomonas alkalisoli]MCE9664050.1 glycosyltransferase family 4 protein [Halomonas alkalisoli]